jgi:hypothetical protein
MNYKHTLKTDTVWAPHYCDLDEYLIRHAHGVRAGPPLPTCGKDTCSHILWDSNFTMFHEQVKGIAALHGYLQRSTAFDLMQAICKSVTITELCDSDEEGQPVCSPPTD